MRRDFFEYFYSFFVLRNPCIYETPEFFAVIRMIQVGELMDDDGIDSLSGECDESIREWEVSEWATWSPACSGTIYTNICDISLKDLIKGQLRNPLA